MSDKIYRNVYFYGNNKFSDGYGHIHVYYSGQVFTNAKNIKNFDKIFDTNQDLLIVCETCAKSRYGKIYKIAPDKITLPNKTKK